MLRSRQNTTSSLHFLVFVLWIPAVWVVMSFYPHLLVLFSVENFLPFPHASLVLIVFAQPTIYIFTRASSCGVATCVPHNQFWSRFCIKVGFFHGFGLVFWRPLVQRKWKRAVSYCEILIVRNSLKCGSEPSRVKEINILTIKIWCKKKLKSTKRTQYPDK